ncbi:hypothetical protein KKF84_16955 [Myxococcota bacterium]|nr:hypothetical protein [Myxococcota bacterium]MBU1537016.1 hypothetical protein [Myxococcota bacterium]
MKWVNYLFVAGLMSLQFVAIGTSDGKPGSPRAGSSVHKGKSATQIIKGFMNPKTDTVKLTMALQPSEHDLRAVFKSPADAKKAAAYYRKMYGTIRGRGIGPKPGQTEVVIFKATSKDLQMQRGASKHFPGGYKRIAAKLRKGLTLYRWKYLERGKKYGMSFDGLLKVKGKWIFIPKPFRALR